jgi:hypothetical protein
MIRYCKIRRLSSDIIFFATGTTSALDVKAGAIIFDARDIAQHVFQLFDGSNFDELADR